MEGIHSILIQGISTQIAGSTVPRDGDGVRLDLSLNLEAFKPDPDRFFDVRSFATCSIKADGAVAGCNGCIFHFDAGVVLTSFTAKTDKIERLAANDCVVNQREPCIVDGVNLIGRRCTFAPH